MDWSALVSVQSHAKLPSPGHSVRYRHRPNREIVMPARITAATTIQALELTNGSTLDMRLKKAATKLLPDAAKYYVSRPVLLRLILRSSNVFIA